jgi:hypothetical protein
VRLAHRKGYALTLVESFVAERLRDCWNDFVALYVKAATVDPAELQFVSDHVRCTNNFRFGEENILGKRDATEDMVLIRDLRQEVERLRALLAGQALSQGDAQGQAIPSAARDEERP